MPFNVHATRGFFVRWLDEAGVSGDTIDRLLGHTAKRPRAKHSMAAVLSTLRGAVERLTVDLGGVSSPCLSTGAEGQGEDGGGNRGASYGSSYERGAGP